MAAIRRPDYPGSRVDVAAFPRADYPGSRADILADGRAGQRMDSPHRQRQQDPSPRHGAVRHSSPASGIADQFPRQARNGSPGRGYRRNEHDIPHGVARSDAGQPMRRDDSPKVVMPPSSDIILRPAMPPSSDQKLPALSRNYLVSLNNREDTAFIPPVFWHVNMTIFSASSLLMKFLYVCRTFRCGG